MSTYSISLCNGGPLHGKRLHLSSPNTLQFTLKGKTGHYQSCGGPKSVAMMHWHPTDTTPAPKGSLF